MRFDAFSPLIESGFKDKMDVYRADKVDNPDGTTDVKFTGTPKYSNVKCKLSFAKLEDPKNKEVDQVPLLLLPKVFCSRSFDVQKGDRIVGYRLDDDGNTIATYTGYVGLPSVFKSHKEVQLLVEGSA